jgi:methylenetetrahydrofolate reductase (NADPH)
MWGEKIESLSDVSEIFLKYIKGTIKRLPWSEGKINPETELLSDFLVLLNSNNMFTVTS